ncbi:Aste57867_23385 [Aphanomyces stellatus]|uniref:Aste57867_23385 protein n=1 Tax=Aphanomyces stellatus TaxID=120398 RepID=A0A485LMM2_9STRA|nr:hypothetical protein As57867_023314 [Aphanomyces stellatus]VFU00031.1 Aste57867_23385 [Aphanomyces stellatus]
MKPISIAALALFAASASATVDRDFECTLNSDFSGGDLTHTTLTLDGCLSDCQTHSDCNAITWVTKSNGKGACYLKSVSDPAAAAKAPATGSPFIVSCSQKKYPGSWVQIPDVTVQSVDPIATIANITSVNDCIAECQKNAACNTVSFIGYGSTCDLEPKAPSYAYAYSKAVSIQATAAIHHNFEVCYAQHDLNRSDVRNFPGTFQDCSKCLTTPTPHSNGFVWSIGPVDFFGRPESPIGHCYCKSLDLFDVNMQDMTQFTPDATATFCGNY